MNENDQREPDMAEPYTDAVVRLTGKDGNAFLVLGLVRRGILRSNRPDLADAFIEEATSSNYDNLLQTCMRYVSIE